ncbi:hypothetical protein [Candidatus Tisiphia endosymbiont of Beris chalybata]|uniref:hypothetical protein n=1 Tax=Candidatus Tisiphia endosymbiont of Beris chalybata TaxID=3066262 RepID=UPI00312C92CE
MREEELRESFEDFINGINDHRVDRNKLHSVEEILFFDFNCNYLWSRRLARY